MNGKYRALSISRLAHPALALFLYAAVLIALTNVKPLWLDEVIQIEATAGTSVHTLVEHLQKNAGAAPVGYLGQHWLISLVGFSVLSARALSVIAGVGTMAVLLVLCRRTGLPKSTAVLAGALWAVCPLAFRYSLEGRPYMQALFFAMLGALIETELSRTCKTVWAVALAACLALALYSQPFAIFASVGFSAANIWQRRNRRYTILTCGSYSFAALCFLPWLKWAQSQWTEGIANSHAGFALTPSLLLLIFRECVGDGYFAAAPALLLASVGARHLEQRPAFDPKLACTAAVASTLVLALAADAAWNYFFAIRQVLYVIPFLLILTAEGITKLWESRNTRWAAVALSAIFVVASLTKNYTYLADHHEDWSALSAGLSRMAGGGCILFAEGDTPGKYAIFRPEIARKICGSSLPDRVVMPVHPYHDPAAYRAAEGGLSRQGLSRIASRQVGFATVEVFGRTRDTRLLTQADKR